MYKGPFTWQISAWKARLFRTFSMLKNPHEICAKLIDMSLIYTQILCGFHVDSGLKNPPCEQPLKPQSLVGISCGFGAESVCILR